MDDDAINNDASASLGHQDAIDGGGLAVAVVH